MPLQDKLDLNRRWPILLGLAIPAIALVALLAPLRNRRNARRRLTSTRPE